MGEQDTENQELPVNALPDLNATPIGKEQVIELNTLEKQRKREKKKERKREARRKKAEQIRGYLGSNFGGEAEMHSWEDSSSEEESPTENRLWRPAGEKKPRNQRDIMETEGGLNDRGGGVRRQISI
ncbi:hypothetical protein R1flu_023172 [Riccia fluitans]|uniref:Uncharacterized protein n=1 Tax=Riccia fluitans TaxID=41844 RepID=A0ABD1XR94_9MARC